MLVPLSWLKEYVNIKLPFPELAAKLSEAGLTIETWKEEGDDIVFDPEITPNRPDWMSVYGIAREISAVTGAKLKKIESFKDSILSKKPKNPLEINVKPNYTLVPRKTSVIIRGVKVKSSPGWLQKRIKQVGLRPINNLVDITNYVLWIYGSLLHVFDYDKIRGHQMTIELSKGGEDFRSLDGIDYKLPQNAIIIKDVGRVIDLLPLKGGENTAVSNQTKNVLLHSVICDPVLTRRTSQALSLRSDSSAIAERGLDPNGTVRAVTHALSLILELAGGEVASEIIDNKANEFKPWVVELNHRHLENVLGIEIAPAKVRDILERLELKVEGEYKVTIPTFRNDIHIEEDLIEEVARIYGYNKFPKTLPSSPVPTNKVAYQRDFDFEYNIKQILKGAGYSEIYTYSLISEKQLVALGIDSDKTLRVDNPISRDYEYLRPHLIGNLLEALKINLPNFQEMNLFELGKTYQGESLDKINESYRLGLIKTGDKFYELKGVVEHLGNELGINIKIVPPEKGLNTDWFHPGRVATIHADNQKLGTFGEIHPKILLRFNIKSRAVICVLKYDLLEKLATLSKKYQSIPKYPAVIEDLSLIVPNKVLYEEVVASIQSSSKLVSSIQLLDNTHEDTKTLRITYLDPAKSLTDKNVAEIKTKFLRKLKELGVKEK